MTTAASPSRKPAGEPQLPPLLQRAVAAHQSGELGAARPLYREFLSGQPEHPTALQLLGLLHSQCGEFLPAIELMQKSLQLFPEQAEVANNLGNALSGAGRLREAVDSYAHAIRLKPDYLDAFRNLGLSYLQLEIFDDARVCFERCVQLSPGDAAAWIGLGNACSRIGDLQRARTCFEKAVSLRPDYAEAHYNLGVCLASMHQPADAMQRYQTARGLGLDRAELYRHLGRAHEETLDPRDAVDAYREAIRRDPEDIASHRELSRLLWEREEPGDHLASYGLALAERPRSLALRMAWARALNLYGRHEEAEKLLMEGLREFPASSALKNQLAFTCEGQQRWPDSVQMHASAVSMPDTIPAYLIDYVRALLACGRPEEALPHAERAIARMPFDQRAIAYIGLCWRLLGDERDAALNDYDHFVQVLEVPVPPQYSDAAAFNERVAAVVRGLHRARRCAARGFVVGGTHSCCDLLGRGEPEIRDLFVGFDQCVHEYINRLPPHRSHPFLARPGVEFEFAASRSVCLAPGGFRATHVRPGAWISAVYCAQAGSGHGGELILGEPDIDVGPRGAALRTLQPDVGQLVLFPSYMWQGTRPLGGEGERIDVLLDAIRVSAA